MLQKRKSDIPALKKELEENDERIRQNPEARLSQLKQGKTIGCSKSGERVEVTAYKHPTHNNEALFVEEMDEVGVVYRIQDCYGDSTLFQNLGDALVEFLGLEGQYMWLDSLAAGHHRESNIWM
jgi:predicted RNase H-like nuclease (RuvC/YqgF family)